jgi:hypothetical protein
MRRLTLSQGRRERQVAVHSMISSARSSSNGWAPSRRRGRMGKGWVGDELAATGLFGWRSPGWRFFYVIPLLDPDIDHLDAILMARPRW